jgi:hypothetical protein
MRTWLSHYGETSIKPPGVLSGSGVYCNRTFGKQQVCEHETFAARYPALARSASPDKNLGVRFKRSDIWQLFNTGGGYGRIRVCRGCEHVFQRSIGRAWKNSCVLTGVKGL